MWFNAKQVVHTLKDINRPEMLIRRAVMALIYGQIFNEFEGSQIILICVYVMIRSSKNNDHFSAFIQQMESLADADTDLHVIKNSIGAIGNWITENLSFENSEYIGEETSKVETYTIADIERIRREYDEKIYSKKCENEKLKKKIELLKQQNEEKGYSEDIKFHDKVRLELLLRLMKKDGADLDKYGNKVKAAEIMKSVTSLPLQTCKNYCSDPQLSTKEHEEEILRLNTKLQALGMEIRL